MALTSQEKDFLSNMNYRNRERENTGENRGKNEQKENLT